MVVKNKKVKSSLSLKSEEDKNHEKFLGDIQKINKKKKLQPLRIDSLKESSATNEIGIETLFKSFSERQNKSKTANLNELERSLSKVSNELQVQRPIQSEKSQNSMVIDVPPSKPQMERNLIKAGYEDVVNERLQPWESIVESNRVAEHINFPLQQCNVSLTKMGILEETYAQYLENQSKRKDKKPSALSQFDEEMAAALKENVVNTIAPGELFTPAEKQCFAAMSLQEAKKKQAELLRFKHLVARNELKARYQNKIKSKKYRRMLRREKVRQKTKELEKLKFTDPQAYEMEMVQQNRMKEKDRLGERISLRHKNTGKWAQHLKLSAKNNPTARHALKEQHDIGKTLTKKTNHENTADSDIDGEFVNKSHFEKHEETVEMEKVNEPIKLKYEPGPSLLLHSQTELNNASDSDDDGAQIITEKDVLDFKNNPWINKSLFSKKMNEAIRESKLTLNQGSNSPNLSISTKKVKNELFLDDNKDMINITQFLNDNNETNIDESCGDGEPNLLTSSMLLAQTKISLNKTALYTTTTTHNEMSKKRSNHNEDINTPEEEINDEPPTPIFFGDLKRRSLGLPNNHTNKVLNKRNARKKIGNDVNKNLVEEAFAEDNVTAFVKEKEANLQAKVEHMFKLGYGHNAAFDTTDMPGWGDWAGQGIKPTNKRAKKKQLDEKKRRKKEIMDQLKQRLEKDSIRKDKHLTFVQLSQDKDKCIAPLQVDLVPYQYNNVEYYESTLRQPIGMLWNPMSITKEMIKPKVLTKPGCIIKPMHRSQLIDKKNKYLPVEIK